MKAIDVHGHFGALSGECHPLILKFSSPSFDELGALYKKAGVEKALCSPMDAIFPAGRGDAFSANEKSAFLSKAYSWLYFWAVLDPRDERTYSQTAALFQEKKCVGIKLHPELHSYPILKYGDEIFAFAACHNAIVETHSGEKNSMPEDFLKWADKYPNVTLIVSHLGCGWDADPSHQVRAVLQAKHHNIYTDTSSQKSFTPGLIEWAVSEIGAEHLFFGTDSPLYFAPMHRARIDCADISEADKEKILRRNALRVFGEKIKD